VVDRRQILKGLGMAAASAAVGARVRALGVGDEPDYRLEIAAYSFEVAARRFVKTIAYNQQVPGALLRLREGRSVTIEVTNHSANAELVHWHGLFSPPGVDGAMEEGTPMIAPGASARYTLTPRPAGMRWYHTHTFAGKDMKRATYTGQHGFLYVEPKENAGRYDREFFLALEDWDGQMLGGSDGSMQAVYDVSAINGKVLGFGEPLQVKQGERAVLHVVNMSATEPHWISLAGHQMQVIALDGNAVPTPKAVPMLRLSPAERVSVAVEMNNPGVWVLGEVREHVKKAGMGIVVEYAGSSGEPVWQQPGDLIWDYLQFGAAGSTAVGDAGVVEVPMLFASKFAGHGALDRWTINGKSYPKTDTVTLKQGQRYRLQFKNPSADDHPVHLHRHSFELRWVGGRETRGIIKDTVLVAAGSQVEVEFTADNPGATLFHCHQQDHMDMGFMMMFRYA
jgi:FtsP/CotA-like multicopper oxidase with cupredoxin domain